LELIDYKKVFESALKLKGRALERYLENISKWDKVNYEHIMIELEFEDCYFPIPWTDQGFFYLVNDAKDLAPQYIIDYFNAASFYSVGWNRALENKFHSDLGFYTDRFNFITPYNTPISEDVASKVLDWFRGNIKKVACSYKPIIKESSLLKLAFKVDRYGYDRYYFRDGFIDLDGDGYGRWGNGKWEKCGKIEDNMMFESSGSVWEGIRI
jgi:hypothetical protein